MFESVFSRKGEMEGGHMLGGGQSGVSGSGPPSKVTSSQDPIKHIAHGPPGGQLILKRLGLVFKTARGAAESMRWRRNVIFDKNQLFLDNLPHYAFGLHIGLLASDI